MELLGPLPSRFALSGGNAKRYFNRKGKVPPAWCDAKVKKWPQTVNVWLRRTVTAHHQAVPLEPGGHPGGQVRVEPGGRVPLQLLPPHHVGAAAGEESHGCPVSEAPLDQLLGPDVQSDGDWDGWSPGTGTGTTGAPGRGLGRMEPRGRGLRAFCIHIACFIILFSLIVVHL